MFKRLSPRRVLAILCLLALVSLFLAHRKSRLIARPANAATQLAHLGLTPASWCFTRLQSGLDYLLHARAHKPGRRMRQRWVNERTWLLNRISQLQAILDTARLVHTTFPGISGRSLRAANVIGYGGENSDTCVLDRGYLDDKAIRPGAVVLARQAVLGRISAVGPKNSTVRLLTNPAEKVMASIIRPTRSGQIPIARLCIVQGIGHNEMRCELPDSVQAIAPEKGDLAALNDNDWPPALRGAVIGKIISVRASEVHQLRWILRIRPRVVIQRARQVVIFLSPARR